jgi:hypothetical protein
LLLGSISVSAKYILVGRYARVYGAVLVVLAIPYYAAFSFLVHATFPASVVQDDIYRLMLSLFGSAALIFGLAVPFYQRQQQDPTGSISEVYRDTGSLFGPR